MNSLGFSASYFRLQDSHLRREMPSRRTTQMPSRPRWIAGLGTSLAFAVALVQELRWMASKKRSAERRASLPLRFSFRGSRRGSSSPCHLPRSRSTARRRRAERQPKKKRFKTEIVSKSLQHRFTSCFDSEGWLLAERSANGNASRDRRAPFRKEFLK